MAGNWEGFTDDDIKYYLDKNNAVANGDAPKAKATNLRGKQKPNLRERRLPQSNSTTANNDLPEAALLLKSSEAVNNEKKAIDEPILPNIPLEPEVLVTASPLRSILEEKTEDNNVSVMTPATLEMFQARQKLLEEHNRQRKELLTRILSDRKKQTTEEAKRLQKIQEELHKLDILLSNDVGILRDEIEVAAREFGEAQNRYSRAEKEFLEAKQNLFVKLERKELLTKHLCTIIEQNEIRKAQKLSELMNQLTVDQSALHSSPSTAVSAVKTETNSESGDHPPSSEKNHDSVAS